jgi:hypothetical protein
VVEEGGGGVCVSDGKRVKGRGDGGDGGDDGGQANTRCCAMMVINRNEGG